MAISFSLYASKFRIQLIINSYCLKRYFLSFSFEGRKKNDRRN